MLALEGAAKSGIHPLDALRKFLVALAVFATVKLFEVHLHVHFFAHCLQFAQVLDGRFELHVRFIDIVRHLKIDKRMEQGIQHVFARIKSRLEIFPRLARLLRLECVERGISLFEHEV